MTYPEPLRRAAQKELTRRGVRPLGLEVGGQVLAGVVEAELLADIAPVGLHGLRGEKELAGYLGVGQVVFDERGDAQFGGGQGQGGRRFLAKPAVRWFMCMASISNSRRYC